MEIAENIYLNNEKQNINIFCFLNSFNTPQKTISLKMFCRTFLNGSK